MLCLLACVDYDVGTTETGKNAGAHPDIEVGVAAVAYSSLVAGSFEERAVPVSSVGSADLHLLELRIEGSSAFSVEVEPTTLAPGSTLDVVVRFTGVQAEEFATLHIVSDDPDSPDIAVALSGGTLVPDLVIWPDPGDFGAVGPSCPASLDFGVQNVGGASTEITGIIVTEPYTVDAPALPLTLAPGEALGFPVSYAWTGTGEQPGQLLLTSTEASISVDLSVTGLPTDDVVDSFIQYDGPYTAVDLVIHVDQSASMDDDQDTLADNVGLLTDALAAMALDWRLIVVTQDSGCYNGAIFDADTEDLETAFGQAVRGGGGSHTEMGLSIAVDALEATCNDDFWRPEEALPHFLLVSDEPEQSPEAPSDLVGVIQSYAATAAISVVVGPLPDGCPTAMVGSGYHEAAALTGGMDVSICEPDWSTAFAGIAGLSSRGTRDRFPLTATPVLSSLVVEVDGRVDAGWSYDAGSNSIVFAEAEIPEAGSVVTASYSLPTDCD